MAKLDLVGCWMLISSWRAIGAKFLLSTYANGMHPLYRAVVVSCFGALYR